MTKEEVINLLESMLPSIEYAHGLVIDKDTIIEFNKFWFIYLQTPRYIITRSPLDTFTGSCSFLVDKEDGKVFSSDPDVEDYRDYLKFRNGKDHLFPWVEIKKHSS